VYFEPGDASSLADAIAEILDDPAEREELGRRNFAAATGIPLSEVVQWHMAHVERLLETRVQS
jgi:glycosyltransferase involved in cell wall biosynthesis